MPAWKHSQYFFKQPDFRQLQPLLCHAALRWSPWLSSILGRKALGLRSRMVRIASSLASSLRQLLLQLTQLHKAGSQCWPAAKHSQYLPTSSIIIS